MPGGRERADGLGGFVAGEPCLRSSADDGLGVEVEQDEPEPIPARAHGWGVGPRPEDRELGGPSQGANRVGPGGRALLSTAPARYTEDSHTDGHQELPAGG